MTLSSVIRRVLLLALSMALLTSCSEKSDPASNGRSRAIPEAKAADLVPVVSRIPVRVTELTSEDVDEVLDLTGTAQPWDTFEVSSEIPGRVVGIHVDEGSWVTRGQLLLELDQEKRLIELQSRTADLAKVKVVLEFARKRLERGQALLEKGAVSESEVDVLDQEVQVAETSVRLSEISIDSLTEEIEDTSIFAQASGQVSTRLVSMGETVNPATPLFTLIQVQPLKVITEITEPYLHKIRQGSKVRLTFEGVSLTPMTGRIHFIHPVSNPASGAFPTEIRLDNPGRRIRPGMVARVQLTAETLKNVLVAPLDSLVDFDGEYYVFTVQDGIASKRPVEIVRRMGARAVIRGDITPGELLVTSGTANLTDGTPVEVIS